MQMCPTFSREELAISLISVSFEEGFLGGCVCCRGLRIYRHPQNLGKGGYKSSFTPGTRQGRELFGKRKSGLWWKQNSLTHVKWDGGLQKAIPPGFCKGRFGYRCTKKFPAEYMKIGCRRSWSSKEGNGLILILVHKCFTTFPHSTVSHIPCLLWIHSFSVTKTRKVCWKEKRQMGWDPHPGERKSTFLYFYVKSYWFKPALHVFVSSC